MSDMLSIIKNACEEAKVPLLPINIAETYKKKQKLSDEAIEKEGNKLYYEFVMRLNDFAKKKSKRLTDTEVRIASCIVEEVIKHGQIEEDRERYDALLNKMVQADVMQERSWNQMRSNLRNKGFFKPGNDNKRYSIIVSEVLVKTLSKKSLNVLIY